MMRNPHTTPAPLRIMPPGASAALNTAPVSLYMLSHELSRAQRPQTRGADVNWTQIACKYDGFVAISRKTVIVNAGGFVDRLWLRNGSLRGDRSAVRRKARRRSAAASSGLLDRMKTLEGWGST